MLSATLPAQFPAPLWRLTRTLLLAGVLLTAASTGLSAAVSAGGNGVAGGSGLNNNNYYPPAPASMESRKFDIVISRSDSNERTLSTLLFRTADLSCDFLSRWNITTLPFTETAKGTSAATFTGSFRDDGGNSLTLSGSASATEISGTIEVHDAADNQTFSYAFHGGEPGSAASTAAKQEAAAAAAPHG
jgi:hypothetical protein